jgi:hypothetical protein
MSEAVRQGSAQAHRRSPHPLGSHNDRSGAAQTPCRPTAKPNITAARSAVIKGSPHYWRSRPRTSGRRPRPYVYAWPALGVNARFCREESCRAGAGLRDAQSVAATPSVMRVSADRSSRLCAQGVAGLGDRHSARGSGWFAPDGRGWVGALASRAAVRWGQVLAGGRYAGPAALHGALCRSWVLLRAVADGSGWPRPAVQIRLSQWW